MHRPGGIFLVHADQLTDAERTTLMTAARVILDDTAGGLASQLEWPQPAASSQTLCIPLSIENTAPPGPKAKWDDQSVAVALQRVTNPYRSVLLRV